MNFESKRANKKRLAERFVIILFSVMTNNLKGKVVLVSGGSRGIGKGIAVELAVAGATVYVTSRPDKSRDVVKSAGTLDELINEVKEKNGTGKIVPVFCDHTNESNVKSLFEQIEREQNGQLDVLVNNAVANVLYTVKNSGVPFHELKDDPAYTYDLYNNCGLRGYYICSTYAARLMVPRKSGLIVTIGSPGSVKHLFSVLYGVQKEANDRMISEMAIELKDTGVLAVALHPGPVETETFKEHVGNSPLFAGAETIYFAGRCLVKLLDDLSYVKERNGQVLLTSDLSERYDIKDLNGKQVKHESQKRLRPLYDAMDKLHTRELHSSTQ
ncbi:Dehydrogenase/reductase SDR family member 1-like [Aphelenchoides besseyi]|nr:Dehydrogenase/reductase SDR family member 1-like [Aphelenchoides besseyi]